MKTIDGRTLSHEVSEHIRVMAVRRVRAGERPSAVIGSYGLCRTTIYKWLRAARRGGESAARQSGWKSRDGESEVVAKPQISDPTIPESEDRQRLTPWRSCHCLT